MLYSLLRPLLFRLSPEKAHDLAIAYLKTKSAPEKLKIHPDISANVMGIQFPNRIGMAAGFDKNGVAIEGIASLGFGFVEIGTVTPEPQTGHEGQRIFRLNEHQAIINRMGSPNDGVDALIQRVQHLVHKPILGINIGKNATTRNEEAVDDYTLCLQKVYPYADYVSLNISSPNTTDLRELQDHHYLYDLLTTLKNIQSLLSHQHKRYVPLVVKVAPDLEPELINEMANVFLATEIDGIIATNTTVDRAAVEGHPAAGERGGLSGKPLFERSNEIIAAFYKHLGPNIPIIGLGGVMSIEDAQAKFDAGASLVQLYTGLIYEGPGLIKRLANHAFNAPAAV